ncbi:MAG: DUF3800 domain-containing protein [Alphaproteobacteria bacterium]|nr:DUF3800 domain-containing protein [Alphaproteobacteria bacterium]
MFLSYVDESGDTGLTNSPTQYFVLSAVSIHESRWLEFTDATLQFRKVLRERYGIPMRAELHAQPLISRAEFDLPPQDRLAVYGLYLKFLASQKSVNVTNVAVAKTLKDADYDVFETAWKVLIQRLENAMVYDNFQAGSSSEHTILLCDNTDGTKLTALVRKGRRYNPIPGGRAGYTDRPLQRVVEDPILRDSASSYGVQAADFCAYALYQMCSPKKFLKERGAHNAFKLLTPRLNRKASPRHEFGVVML